MNRLLNPEPVAGKIFLIPETLQARLDHYIVLKQNFLECLKRNPRSKRAGTEKGLINQIKEIYQDYPGFHSEINRYLRVNNP